MSTAYNAKQWTTIHKVHVHVIFCSYNNMIINTTDTKGMFLLLVSRKDIGYGLHMMIWYIIHYKKQ